MTCRLPRSFGGTPASERDDREGASIVQAPQTILRPPEASRRDSSPAQVGRHFAACAMFAVLVGISNASLLPNLDRALPGGIHEDPYTATWLLGWELRHLTALDFAGFWSPDLCYPDTEWSLSRLETHPGLALLGMPIYLAAGRNAVVAYNAVFLLNLLLAALAAYILCWQLTRCWPAALMGGAIFGLSPYLLFHRNHLALLAAAPIPLALLGSIWFVRDGRRSGLWLAGASLIIEFYFQLQYGVLLVGFCGLFFLAMVLVFRPRTWRRMLLSFAGMLGVVAITTAPWAIQYIRGHRALGLESRSSEADYNGARLENLLASPDSSVLGSLTGSMAVQETALYPGIAVLLLAGLGLSGSRRTGPEARRESKRRTMVRRAAWTILLCALLEAMLFDKSSLRFGLATVALWLFPIALGLELLRPGPPEADRDVRPILAFFSCLSLLFAFGPTLRWFDDAIAAGPYRLLSCMPVLSTMRAPGRYGVFFFVCLAVLAAYGVARLDRWGREGWAPARLLLFGSMVAWALEASPKPTALQSAPVAARLPEVYRWLAHQPRGPYSVLELPTDGLLTSSERRPVFTTRQLMRNLDHHQPVTMLWAGYNCPMDIAVAQSAPWDRVPSRGLFDPQVLRRARVRYLVVHPRDFASDQIPAVLSECDRLECEVPVVYRDAETIVFDLPFWAEPTPAASLDLQWLRLDPMPKGVLAGGNWSEIGVDARDPAPLSLAETLTALPKGYLLLVASYDEPTNSLDADALAALRTLGLGSRLSGNYGVAYAAMTSTGSGLGEPNEAVDRYVARLDLKAGAELVPMDVTIVGSTNPYHGGLTASELHRGEYELALRDRGLNFLLVDPDTLETVDRFSYDTHRSVRSRSPASWLHAEGIAQLRLPAAPSTRSILSLGLRLGSAPWDSPSTVSVDRDGTEIGHCEIVREVTDCRMFLTPSGTRPSGFVLALRGDRSIVVDWARYLRPD